jgi:hypothetical protein
MGKLFSCTTSDSHLTRSRSTSNGCSPCCPIDSPLGLDTTSRLRLSGAGLRSDRGRCTYSRGYLATSHLQHIPLSLRSLPSSTLCLTAWVCISCCIHADCLLHLIYLVEYRLPTLPVFLALLALRNILRHGSCYQLLREIKDMGGEDHGTIRAAVLEQMADAHLSRVNEFSVQGREQKRQRRTQHF